MRNNSLSYAEEARRDELEMLRYSCIGPDEHDRKYTIDEAYAAYEEMER